MNRKLEHVIGFLINLPTLGCYRIVEVETHHCMVDGNCSPCVIEASFADFKKAFEKTEWKINREFRDSLFTADESSVFHASIIRINHVGYLLTTYGWIRANALRKKKTKELNRALANSSIIQSR
jgi:hypothetical protein